MRESSQIEKRKPEGRVYITLSSNGVNLQLCDMDDKKIYNVSNETLGKKRYMYNKLSIAQEVSKVMIEKLNELGINCVDLILNGFGSERLAVISSISGAGVNINTIRDITPIPHNGARRPVKRK